MKKIFLILAVLLALACMLVGCSGSSGDNGNDTSDTSKDTSKDTSSDISSDIPPANCTHSYGEWKVLDKATCVKRGFEVRECELCHNKVSRYTDVLGHTEVIDEAKEATCTEDGNTEGKHCSVCGFVIVASEVISKDTAHEFLECTKVITEPSISSKGKATFKCSKCSTTKDIELSKLESGLLTKNDIYSIETNDKFNPAVDNAWKVIDGNKKTDGLYTPGSDWFGNVGDILTITLDQEMVLTDLSMYIEGNYTTATVRIKNANGKIVKKSDIRVNSSSTVTQNIVSGVSLDAYTIEIEITSLKWDSYLTFKVAELDIKAARTDTRLPHTHIYREYVGETLKATCQKEGKADYACYCDKTKSVSTPKTACSYDIVHTSRPATCVDEGYALLKCTCGNGKEVYTNPKGHTYAKLVKYTSLPTISSGGQAQYKCIGCELTQDRELSALPIDKLNYLRVAGISNGKVTLKFNIYGDKTNYEVRYSNEEITSSNFNNATVINAEITGTREISAVISLDAGLENGYYVAIRPYMGSNYGEIATIRVGGNGEIVIDYDKAQIYHGEVLSSFKPMFDNDITTKLGVIFPNSGDTAELYGSKLSPIIDLEYMHYVSKVSLYYDNAGKSVKIRWADTPTDFMAEDSRWDGTKTITSVQGWNEIEIGSLARYIQVIFTDGDALCEVKAYGYQLGEGDKISQETGKLPTMGEMMGMCGFTAGGGGYTPIDSVKCTTVLREYHNFGWSYDVSKYGSKASFFTIDNWPGNFDKEYKAFKEAGINVVPCIQWSLGNGETISYKVDENNLPVYENGKLVRTSFWERFDPDTYFVYADNLFAFSARYGSNNSYELLDIANRYCSSEASVGQGTIQWIEMGNEPDGGWNGIHNYLSAYQLAAATSAAYDGHCKTLKVPSNDGYHFGIKNADPNMKAALAGVSGVSNEYIMALCYWMRANRQDGSVAFDAFNVHHYMTKQVELENGHTYTVGASPEETNLAGVLSALVETRDKYYPDKEVWITEFGWDTNQSYSTSTSAHAYGEYTGRQVQAMWLTRAYLIISSTGVDKATMYMCEDTGSPENEAVGKYGSAGVIAYVRNENGELVEEKKDSYYYLYTLKSTLGDYTFNGEIEAYDDNVMIYEYKTNEGKTAYAVWCPTSDGTRVDGYQLKIDGTSATLVEAKYGDTDGVKTGLTADDYGYVSVNVSESPIYIVVD